MLAVRSAVRGLLSVLCLGALVCGMVRPAIAQEDFFKPVLEAAPTKKPKDSDPQIFSFARFSGEFTALCVELEEDGRRDRLVQIAEAGVAREKECITCRSFWKMFVSACGRLGPRPPPTPKPTKRPKRGSSTTANGTSEESPEGQPTRAEGQEGGDEASASPQETPIAPTPTKAPKQERYPSVALINEASRLSTAVYALDSGEGQVAKTFQYFAKTVRETPEMSSAEREYYDIFLTYLLAAWDGRVDRTKLPTPTPSADLQAFFE